MLSENLTALRKRHGMTQEEVAEKLGVSRQTVAKWESGETAPDIAGCNRLAGIYEVTLDNLINYEEKGQAAIPPKGKHTFGVVTVGERGQIVLPKKARDIFHINAGDRLIILGDEQQQAIAILKEQGMLDFLEALKGEV